MSRLAKLVPATERRDWGGPWGPTDGTIPGPGDVSYTIGDTSSLVGEAMAMRLIDAYACVSILADDVSQLPLDAYRKVNGVRGEVSPTPTLVDRPDPEIERWDYMSRVVTSLALRGNSYSIVLARSLAGYPTAVRAIHPDDITVTWGMGGKREYRLRGSKDVLGSLDVIHIPLVTVAGGLKGLSPLDVGRRGIRMAIETEQFGDRWFVDGAAPSSVLESKDEVGDDEARKTLARWVASHGGRRRPALLSGGLTWKPITITPEESQFLGTRSMNTSQIARLWRIPPHMIGDVDKTTSWGTGIEEQGIGYTVHTLGPYLTRIEAAFTRQMPKPQYAKFNVGAMLRGKPSERYSAYAIGRQWGWLSVNDIRALEDMPPLADGGDTYLQPMNMVDAEQALAAAKVKAIGPPAADPVVPDVIDPAAGVGN